MRLFKFLSFALVGMLLAGAAQAASAVSGNFGSITQLNAATLQLAETNTLGFVVVGNTITTQAAGNAVAIDQDNDSSFLVLNAGVATQTNFLTVQAARTNTLGIIVAGNEINTSAIGNLSTAEQSNNLTLLGANLVGNTQTNFLTVQVAQTNTVGGLVAGNTISTVAGGNVSTLTQSN